MQTITPAQARAIEVITKELDKVVPGRGKDYMDVILGVLNLEIPTQIECVLIPHTGIGNDTPVKSLDETSSKIDLEKPIKVFDNMPKITTPPKFTSRWESDPVLCSKNTVDTPLYEERKYPIQDVVEVSKH
jgi:hypothetical protein